jgi:hypothetical protein
VKTLEASTIHIPDEALPEAPKDITLRAMPGCAIVWFLPYRRAGESVIELPQQCQMESVEAIVVHDNTGYELPAGTKVLVSRVKGEGVYIEVGDVRLCRIRREGLYLVDLDHKAA